MVPLLCKEGLGEVESLVRLYPLQLPLTKGESTDGSLPEFTPAKAGAGMTELVENYIFQQSLSLRLFIFF
ncbi:MAG: hypothetical protein A3E27_05255 [Deltaproteobacteria bacterium RIFCSPHIGHO2_12_FULL_40_32]|nr:MAG: hypothetical protein A3C45_04495 [Deltaproteobacteria bacterium RIFCSPHIGHO2_02_FULL_40_28]OGQ21141.1 MAG: hypothetical protein A3E27_05255 [Deltaproteobacteria bacterium RIFCSPHIGHO2_12_FULL_40_32]